jgi:heat shock protein HtpX
MATLYSLAEKNVRKTWFLMIILVTIVIALGWWLSSFFGNIWILVFAIGWSILMNVGAYWWSDKIVLRWTGAKLVEKLEEPELYRVVENLCLSVGLPMSRLFILESSQLNAFATGRNSKHATIVITRGLLERLDKNEIEGVISHELSHIRNKDILLGTIIVVLGGTISLIANISTRSSFGRRDRNKGGGTVFFVMGMLGIILAPLAAAVIQAAISRKREFLADASGALMTRYPEGLVSALEKMSVDKNHFIKANHSTAHLFIVSPFKEKESKGWISRIFMTHPPIEARIKRLKGMKV